MAAHPAACWCPDCVSSLRSELDADVLASTIQSGVSLDRRGFIRLSAEDRPGVRSPVSENACSSPRDIPVASADSSPALRESEIGYPVRTASCASCELLRAEIAALRNELLLARSSEFHAIWGCSARLAGSCFGGEPIFGAGAFLAGLHGDSRICWGTAAEGPHLDGPMPSVS